MSFWSETLASGERVHLVTREHGVVLVPAFLRAAAVVAAAGTAAILVSRVDRLGPARIVPAGLAGLVAAHALLRLARRVHRWQMRRLIITDRRAILLAGGVSRRMASLPLDVIETVEVRTPGAGRMLHYGALVIGSGDRRVPLFGLRRLPDPDLLMGLVLGLDGGIAAGRGPSPTRVRPASQPAVAPR